MTDLLSQQAEQLFRLSLSPTQQEQFALYERELVAWNTHTNLTAITDPEGVRIRHFLDSLSVVEAVPMKAGLRVIDVGTGAGFPGIPLKILFPEIEMTLLEATGKKINFLKHVAETLDISKGIHFVNLRAEEAGQAPDQRAKYDVVLARAVARLPILLEYLLPLATIGGVCVAMKGRTAREEVNASTHALQKLGGVFEKIIDVNLPDTAEPHHLVLIRKVAHTPSPYPRRSGLPTQKPL